MSICCCMKPIRAHGCRTSEQLKVDGVAVLVHAYGRVCADRSSAERLVRHAVDLREVCVPVNCSSGIF